MKFAEIVRSSEQLRNTFDRVSGLAFWWRVLLALHGKPVSASGTANERIATLARGFRFYGYLYLGLGILLLLGVGVWFIANPSSPWYWLAVSAFSSLYLIASSTLAFRGANNFAARETRGAALLVTFFVSIIIFLAAFGAFVSSWIHTTASLYDLPNIALFAAFILFGIGSYLIELLYLVWWRSEGYRRVL